MTNAMTRTHSRIDGFTVIELLVAVVVIVVASAAAFSVWNLIRAGQNAQQESQALLGIVAESRALYGTQGSFEGVSEVVLIDARMVPVTMIIPGNPPELQSSWNGLIRIAENPIRSRRIDFIYADVPEDVCARFVRRSHTAFDTIVVNGVPVKDVGMDLDVTLLATNCINSAGTITFTAGLSG